MPGSELGERSTAEMNEATGQLNLVASPHRSAAMKRAKYEILSRCSASRTPCSKYGKPRSNTVRPADVNRRALVLRGQGDAHSPEGPSLNPLEQAHLSSRDIGRLTGLPQDDLRDAGHRCAADRLKFFASFLT